MVVDRFMKMAHFIPCNKSTTSEKMAKIFFDHVFVIMDLSLHPSFRSGPSNY
jgi:hypothetical protein